ncbi:NTP/NDP exchange transporter [Chryseobacterium koreense]
MNKEAIFQKLQQAIKVKPDEVKALTWGWLYIFVLFIAYYVLRPIRDELGVAGGVENLSWLFLGTLLSMIALNPLYACATKKWSREKFIALTYRFFSLNLLLFMAGLMLATPEQHIWIGRIFFVWVSVFNLFVVSVFWSLIVDVFNSEQGKRLFGFLAAGATVGGIVGAALTSGLVEKLGQNWLLLISVVLLEFAVFASKKLSFFSSAFHTEERNVEDKKAIGGSILSGLTHTLRSPYLIGIGFFILLNSVVSTFLYFQQADIVSANFADRESRTVFFANIDLWVNVFTLLFQLFIASRLLKATSVAVVLCILPLVSMLGFGVLAIFPTVTMLVIVQVARRVSNFGLSRPTREILFTAIPREDRYKAKNFIDTVVYRFGDQAGSWAYTGLSALGLGIAGISVIAVPVSAIWLGLGFWLGKKQSAKERAVKSSEVSP